MRASLLSTNEAETWLVARGAPGTAWEYLTTYYRPDVAVEGLSFTKGLGLGARRAVAEAHELVHVGRAIFSPQLTYLGAFSRGPGAGFANIALEAEAYYLTEGLSGLRNVLPSVANSGRLRHVAVDFGIAGLIGDAVPGFTAILAEHLAEFGELLPHVLMGAFVQNLEERASTGDLTLAFTALDVVQRVFLAGDSDAQELISFSFLENLDPSHILHGELRKRMGPTLLAELATYEALL